MTKAESLERIKSLQYQVDFLSKQISDLSTELQRSAETTNETVHDSFSKYRGHVPVELLEDHIRDSRMPKTITDDIILIEGDKVRVLRVETDGKDYIIENEKDRLNVTIVKVVDEYEDFLI